jgi:hypothetical protein
MEITVMEMGDHVVLTLTEGFKEMQERVKEESSQLAVRQRDGNGNTFFDELALDEAYETKLRAYWYQAQGEIEDCLSAYTKFLPGMSVSMDTTEAGADDNYVVQLIVPSGFHESKWKSVGFKVEEFMEAYIMYRWLETKLPGQSALYYERMTRLKPSIGGNLNMRANSIRRRGSWF